MLRDIAHIVIALSLCTLLYPVLLWERGWTFKNTYMLGGLCVLILLLPLGSSWGMLRLSLAPGDVIYLTPTSLTFGNKELPIIYSTPHCDSAYLLYAIDVIEIAAIYLMSLCRADWRHDLARIFLPICNIALLFMLWWWGHCCLPGIDMKATMVVGLDIHNVHMSTPMLLATAASTLLIFLPLA